MLERVRVFADKIGERKKSLGSPLRYVAIAAVVVLAAFVLLWAFDKIVMYYLARSYVDQLRAPLI